MGTEVISGGAGVDTVSLSGSNVFTVGSLSSIEALAFTAAATATFNASQVGTDLPVNLAVTGGTGTQNIIVNMTNPGSLNLSGLTFSGWTSGADFVSVNGSAGDDKISGTSQNDSLAGGAGTDTLSYADSGAAVAVNLAVTTAQATGGAGYDTISGFENLTGSAYNDTLTGNTLANILDGGLGNDILTGGAGNDTLDGGVGTDTAIFSGNWRDYTITQNTDAAGSYFELADRRNGAPNGVDRIYGVEKFQFADGIITVNAASDLLNDGPTGASWKSGGNAAENSAAKSIVGTVQGIDPDTKDLLTYSLTDNANGFFCD